MSSRSLSSNSPISACLLAIVSATISLILWDISFIRRSVASIGRTVKPDLPVAYAFNAHGSTLQPAAFGEARRDHA